LLEPGCQGKSPSREASSSCAARALVLKRGRPSDADIEAARKAGFGDGEIAEIIAHVARNIFTNYFNNAAAGEVDFPKVELKQTE
jgi:alkylhydroperoxidase family enzyme